MDIIALLSATAGSAKPGTTKHSGLGNDGEHDFARSMAQIAGTSPHVHQHLGDGGNSEQHVLTDLVSSAFDGAPRTLADLPNGFAQAIDHSESEFTPLPHGDLAALEDLLTGQRYDRKAEGTLDMALLEDDDLLEIVRERMALIENAGLPQAQIADTAALQLPAEPGTPLHRLVVQASGPQAIQPAMVEADTTDGEESLLDPARPRDTRDSDHVTRRDALAVDDRTRASLATQATAAPPTQPLRQSLATGDTPPQPLLGSRSEGITPTAIETPGAHLAAPPSAQGSTASPQVVGQPLASPAGATLTAPIASQQWQQQLGQQMIKLSQHGDQRIELRLNPAELGPLSISLKMSEHGAQAQFLSAHAQVRAAVEQAIPQLREALEEQGISLSDTMVGEHDRGQRDEASLASNGGAAEQARQRGNEEPATEALSQAPLAHDPTLEGRVDLYA